MNLDHIIERLIAGKASAEELKQLEGWKKEAAENAKALEEMREIAALSSDLQGYQDFGSDKAFEKFESTVIEETAEANVIELPKTDNVRQLASTPAKKKPFNWALASAAAVFLIVAGLFFFSDSFSKGGAGNLPTFTTVEKTNAEGAYTLSDQSTVFLAANSTLKEASSRSVYFDGKGFFDITSNKEEPFTIELDAAKIVVLGTSFSVQTEGADFVKVIVKEGHVQYITNRTIDLFAGDMLVFEDGIITKVANDDANAFSWKTKKLVFKDQSLSDVVKSIEDRYDVEISIEDYNAVKNCRVSTSFNNETIEEVLTEFSSTLGLKYAVKEGKYVIFSSNC